MRILLVGGGATGSIITHFLLKEKWVDLIIIGDINLKKVKKNISHHKKIRFKKMDASEINQIIKISKEFNINVIVNSALPYFNIPILKAALRVRAHYLDLAALWVKNRRKYQRKAPYQMEQLYFDDKFKKRNLIGLINAGAAPGLTNLLVAECANNFEKIEEIKIRLFEDVEATVPFSAWSKEYTLDEFIWPPIVYEKKKFIIKKSFAEEEFYRFPEPIGKQKTYLLAQDEAITIPQNIKLKKLTIKSGGREIEFAKHLYNLGLFDKKRLRFGKTLIAPYKFMSRILPPTPSPKEMIKLIKSKKVRDAILAISIEVNGLKNRKEEIIKYSVVFPSQKELVKILPGATYISYPTGLMAAIFISILRKIKRRGVFPPEGLDAEARRLILEKLSHYKIDIEIKKTTI